jgi:hypothetical protein
MKYTLSVISIALLMLASGALAACCGENCNGQGVDTDVPGCPGCPPGDTWVGNLIEQNNYQQAKISLLGEVYEKGANWGVVAGDDNYLNQDNVQRGASNWFLAASNATNVALILGNGNDVIQLNDPAPSEPDFEIDIPFLFDELLKTKQLNEIIVLGDENNVLQQNWEKSKVRTISATIAMDQWNFGMILGDGNILDQNNSVKAYTNTLSIGGIDQTQANAAYLYGFNNSAAQRNNNYAELNQFTVGSIDQTAKNLAFAVSSCCATDFVPICENQTVTPECPGFPVVPEVPAWNGTLPFPMDP